MNQKLLDEIVHHLNKGGTNYSVYLRYFEVPYDSEADSAAYVVKMLGKEARIGGIENVTGEELISEIGELIQYEGDSGAGPDLSTLRSDTFAGMVTNLKVELAKLVDNSVTVEKLWLAEGHPAYPVFWDFAALFRCSDKSGMFIGSASD